MPGIPFPAQLKVTADLDEALGGAELVLFAVPSQQMRANARMASPHLPRTALVLSAAKGLEVGSCRRMTEVLAEERCVLLVGPGGVGKTAAVHEPPPAAKLDWKNQTGFKSSGHAHHGELAAWATRSVSW